MHVSELMRISQLGTRILGPEYSTSLDRIEIDITYECNLKCFGCNRSCSQAPDSAYMSIDQIEKFISESINLDRQWRRIRILGGEPYLHPEIFIVLDKLLKYQKESAQSTSIEISTNGYSEIVNKKINETSKEVVINNTHKNNPNQVQFEPFNKAPCDSLSHLFTDYKNACWITNECGLGLNMYGFYHCAVAAGIDRVIGLDIGLKTMPSSSTDFSEQKKNLCRLCGHFWSRKRTSSHSRRPLENIVSESWKEAYSENSKKRPILTRY